MYILSSFHYTVLKNSDMDDTLFLKLTYYIWRSLTVNTGF